VRNGKGYCDINRRSILFFWFALPFELSLTGEFPIFLRAVI